MKKYIRSDDYSLDESLAFSPNARSRAQVAAYATSPDLLFVYAHDPTCGVREHVAKNRNASAEVLLEVVSESMSDISKYWDVFMAAIYNPNTPPEALAMIATCDEQDPDALDMVMDVANDSRLPEDIIEKLAHHEDEWVRVAVTHNPKLSDASLHKLLKDSVFEVREAAAKELRLRGGKNT